MVQNKSLFIASLFIALLFSPTNALADSQIEQFVFATDQQIITSGEISKEIIIEARDLAGNPNATSETIDLKFYSDSATGEFLNESGNPASTVMNKGWKSRKFFYRDSTSGTHTLKIEFSGRDSQKIWSASQQITISDNQNSNTTNPSSETAQNTNPSSENIISNTPSSSLQTPTSIQADAGDNIIALLGQEIIFDASKSQGASIYEWNFGDGSTSKDKIAKHKYNFPGKYIITLAISNGESESRNQITASIYPSGVYISEFLPSPAGSDDSEWVEIYNSNNFPVDLSDWKLDDEENKAKSFIIPQNTFIAAKNYLVLPRSATKIALNNDKDSVRFYYPEGIIIDEIKYEKSKEEYSAARRQDGGFVWTKNITPGAPNIFLSESTTYQNNNSGRAVSVDSNSENPANLIAGASKYAIVNAGNFSVKNFISTASAQTVAQEEPAQNSQNDNNPKTALENKNNSGNISADIREAVKQKGNKNMISRIILTLFTLAIFAMMWQVMKRK